MDEKYIYLPKDTKLSAGKYIIKRNMSERSNRSIAYFGFDRRNLNKVVIKEFFPNKVALRDLDKKTLICKSNKLKEKYEKQKEVFLREGEILKNLDNKNIVKCYDYFKENDTAYIVLEYHSGLTLDEYIIKNPIDKIDIFFEKIFFPILDTVEYIHNKNIIHRDIKPSNIIIKKSGNPVLIDFGSISTINKKNRREIFLTPGFSPLEFYSEKSKQGRYSDIYSLAATLYYCFSQEVPIESSKRIFEDNLKETIFKNKAFKNSIKKVLIKNLNLKYKKRYKKVSKLKKSLKYRCIYKEKVKKFFIPI